MDLDRIEILGPRQHSDDEGSKLLGRLEQKAALNAPTGHLYQGTTCGNEAKSACHTPRDVFEPLNLAESPGTEVEDMVASQDLTQSGGT